MIHPKWSPAVAVLLAAIPAAASLASEVSANWTVNYLDNITGSSSGDLVGGNSGGGSSPSGAISTGNAVGVSTFTITYPPNEYLGTPELRTQWTGVAGGEVTFGHIVGGVGSSLDTTRGIAASDAYFYAQWSDVLDVTILGGAQAGTQATVVASMLVEVNPSSANSAPSIGTYTSGPVFANLEWTAGATYAATSEQFHWERGHATDTGVCYFIDGNPLDCGTQTSFAYLVPIRISFTVGDPVPLDVFFSAHAGSATGSGYYVPYTETGLPWQASSSLGFSNTVSWQGISAVLDADGSPMNFTVTSESGTDWTQPITAVETIDTDADGISDYLDLDDDNDTMPDDYELANGLNPLDPSDADADADGDGYTNLQEFKAGTDPQNPADAPRPKQVLAAILLLLGGDPAP